MSTDNHYVGLSHREIQALGQVSGECFRLYVAVASFAYGSKVVAHPKWSDISKRMGKKLSPNQGRQLAKKLEAAGLIQRGTFGNQDRWRLVLKEQVISERGTQKGGESPTNTDPTPLQKDTHPPTKRRGVNKKNKKENKDNHISKIKKGEEFQSENGLVFSKDKLRQRIEMDNYGATQMILSLNDWDEIFKVNEWLGEFRREGLMVGEIQRRLTDKLMSS